MRFAVSIIALATPLFVAAAPWKRQDSATNLLVLSTYSPLFFLSSFSLPFVPVLCFLSLAIFGTGLTLVRSLSEFADVLEQLESKFYSEALAKFKESDFITAGFTNAQLAIEQFLTIQTDEATHSVALRVRPRILI